MPDLNLLVHAYNDGAPRWWEGLINGMERIGVPWVVATGFVRIVTHPGVVTSPVSTGEAVGHVGRWFQYAHLTPINPGHEHLTHLRRCLDAAGVGANLVADRRSPTRFGAAWVDNDSTTALQEGSSSHFPKRRRQIATIPTSAAIEIPAIRKSRTSSSRTYHTSATPRPTVVAK